MIIGVFYDLSCVLTGVITRWKSKGSPLVVSCQAQESFFAQENQLFLRYQF